MAKWVYMFTEGNADMRNLLGGKGANLAEMTNLGLPYRRASPSQQKLVRSTMKTAERSMMRSWHRSWKQLQRWKRSPERNSVTKKIHCLFPFVRCESFYARNDGHHPEPGSE